MQISFKVLGLKERPTPIKGTVQLTPGDWDDHTFKTSFVAVYFDREDKRVDLGGVKIGYRGQQHGWTREKLPPTFAALPEDWFSLGQDVDYYKAATQEIDSTERDIILSGLRDVAANEALLTEVQHEKVFAKSLMRDVSFSIIQGQFKRVLNGLPALSDFHFSYRQEGDKEHAAVELDFRVNATSKPSTNIHVLIGRNGVGKTTLLNNMVDALVGVQRQGQPQFSFVERSMFSSTELPRDYFSRVVSVSFSAFDPFLPPVDRADRQSGPAYFYIGMKKARFGHNTPNNSPPKTDAELVNDFIASFRSCLAQPAKRESGGGVQLSAWSRMLISRTWILLVCLTLTTELPSSRLGV